MPPLLMVMFETTVVSVVPGATVSLPPLLMVIVELEFALLEASSCSVLLTAKLTGMAVALRRTFTGVSTFMGEPESPMVAVSPLFGKRLPPVQLHFVGSLPVTPPHGFVRLQGLAASTRGPHKKRRTATR